jgi:hypothetical protein
VSVFQLTPFISNEVRAELSTLLMIPERSIKVWFQNRRQRSRIRRIGSGAPCKAKGGAPEDEKVADRELAYSNTGVTGVTKGNTACLWHNSMEMECITEAAPPFAILWATPDWLAVTGYEDFEVRGNTFKVIQGPDTNTADAAELAGAAYRSSGAQASLVNYTKRGKPFAHAVTIDPLVDSKGALRLFKVRTTFVKPLDGSS